MRYKIKFLLSVLFIASFFACTKKPGSASWDIDVVTPLITSTLTVNHILADSLVQQNADSSLKIVYNTTLYSFSVDSLVDIPDTIKQVIFNSQYFTITAQPGQTIVNTTDNKNLDLGNAVITKIIIKSGYVNLHIKNTILEKILTTYTIPCANSGGNILQLTDLIPAATISGPTYYSTKVDISGYTFDLTGPNGTNANILTSVIQARIDPNGSPVLIEPSDSLDIMATFDDLVIDYAKGYFGTQSFESGQKSSDFDLFKKITDGTLSLEDLNLVLTVENGFGVDASLFINEIKSVNSYTGNTVALNSNLIGSAININRALETFNASDPVIPTVTAFNLDNSNFKQLIENLPDKIEYSIDVTTDPLGNVSSGNDFIYNKYGFNADLDLEIPLSLIASNLTLTDTIDFNLSKPEGFTVNSGMLTLIANNGFPLSAKTQIYLLNENNILTDSLITSANTILPAPLSPQDVAIGKQQTKINIIVTGDRLDHLYAAKKIKIVVRFNTAMQGHYIKIYSNYSIEMKVTGDFNMTVNDN